MNETNNSRTERDLAEPSVEETVCENQQRNPQKIRDIKISQLDFGYIVTIGCQKFAIENMERLLYALRTYMEHPSETEDDWFDGKFLR